MEVLIDFMQEPLVYAAMVNLLWIGYHFYEISRKNELIRMLDKENDQLLISLIQERKENEQTSILR